MSTILSTPTPIPIPDNTYIIIGVMSIIIILFIISRLRPRKEIGQIITRMSK